jgi:hypothetical protein
LGLNYLLNFSDLIKYDTTQPRITLDVKLKFGAAEEKISAKLDTGSTDCIFARKTGESLGLQIEDGTPASIGTATGVFRAYLHQVTITFLNFEFDVYVYFAEEENFKRNILGRVGFFDQIVLGLVDYEGKLFLNRY